MRAALTKFAHADGDVGSHVLVDHVVALQEGGSVERRVRGEDEIG